MLANAANGKHLSRLCAPLRHAAMQQGLVAKVHRLACALLPALVMVLAGAVTAWPDGLDEVIPDNVVFSLAVRDVPQLLVKLKALPLYELLMKPGVRQALGDTAAEFAEGLQQFEDKLGISLAELQQVMTGEAIAFFLAEDLDDVPPGGVILEIGGKHDQAEALLKRFRQQARDEGWQDRTHEFAGVTIIESLTPDRIPGEEPVPDFFCLTDRYFLFMDSLELTREVLIALTREPSGGLAASPDYQSAKRGAGRDADVFFYLNTAPLWAEAEKETDLGAAVMRELKFDSVRTLGVAAGIEGQNLWTSLYLYAPGEKAGIWSLLPPAHGRHRPPRWVPEGAMAYYWVNLDYGNLWRTVNDVIRFVSPESYVKFRSSLVIPGETGEPVLDVENDIVSVLGRGLSVYVRALSRDWDQEWAAPPGSTGELPGLEAVWAVALLNGRMLNDTIVRLRGRSIPPFSFLQPTEFQGHTLYTFSAPHLQMRAVVPGGDEATGPASPQLAALTVLLGYEGGNALVVALGLQELQDVVLRAAGAPRGLADSESYRETMSHVPGDASVIGYVDLRRWAEAIVDHVRRYDSFPAWFAVDADPGSLPPLEDILPHLNTAVCFGVHDETGFLLKTVVLAPTP